MSKPDTDNIPPQPELARTEDLIAIMARLRDPHCGCPWDLEQTFHSIAPCTLEEAYEVAEAIERNDLPGLCDELGDLLLQVVYHARMAEEQDAFAYPDVVRAICTKLVRRHPHVFGEGAQKASIAHVKADWERIKAAERAARTPHQTPGLLDGIARTLPALVRAEKLQKRAARVGFDWDAVDAVFAAVQAELEECRETYPGTNTAAREHELGDLLFSCVNLARHLGVDAEQALRTANRRFERRFGHIEARLRATGLEPGAAQRERMEALWQEAKALEAPTGREPPTTHS